MERIDRAIGRPFLDAIEEHATQVGQIVWGWNFLQSQFLHVFRELVCAGNESLALALWHSLPSDKAQRDMTVNVASVVVGSRPALLADITWVRAQAHKIGEMRNASVHTGIAVGADNDWADGVLRMKVFPDVRSAKPSAAAMLSETPVCERWDIIRDDLWVLGRYTTSLAGLVNGNSDYGGPFLRPDLMSLT